jgi:hypothetical protein
MLKASGTIDAWQKFPRSRLDLSSYSRLIVATTEPARRESKERPLGVTPERPFSLPTELHLKGRIRFNTGGSGLRFSRLRLMNCHPLAAHTFLLFTRCKRASRRPKSELSANRSVSIERCTCRHERGVAVELCGGVLRPTGRGVTQIRSDASGHEIAGLRLR